MPHHRFASLFALVILLPFALHAQTTQDGRLFDTGQTMSERSTHAPEVTDRMLHYLGEWDVTLTTWPTDSTMYTAQGHASVTFMNRGHAFMERMQMPALGDTDVPDHTMRFLAFTPINQAWAMGEASSYTGHIAMYNGDFVDDVLTLTTAMRETGGVPLTWYRLTYTFDGPDALTMLLETSPDGQDWTARRSHAYTRRATATPALAVAANYGQPAASRPDEAAGFDFLIGTWDAAHELFLGGRWIQYPSTTTATYVLGGHGILEHSWMDLDPSLPDAATSILRLYNHAARRWESLYLSNRGNALLHFGGQQVGEDIVLHPFEVHHGNSPITRYTFHNITPDHYDWTATTSTDRGATFNETWRISITKRSE